MKLYIKNLISFSLLIILATHAKAFAYELVIEDQAGNIRHVSEIDGKVNLRLSVTNLSGQPVEGSDVKLEFKETASDSTATPDQTVKMSQVFSGLAQFKDVSPGKWVISVNSDSVVLADIDVLDPAGMMAQAGEETVSILGIQMTESTAIIVGGTIGVVVGVGAAVGIGLALDDDDGSNDEPSPFQ